MYVRLGAAIAAATLLSSAACAEGAKLTDPQIAHIAYTADNIDIAAAKQALTKPSNKDVKALAEDMVRDHEAVNKQALETLLIPSACNAELKGLLQTGLKIFEGHQQHAEHVAAELK